MDRHYGHWPYSIRLSNLLPPLCAGLEHCCVKSTRPKVLLRGIKRFDLRKVKASGVSCHTAKNRTSSFALLLLLCLGWPALSHADITSGLVAHYKFENDFTDSTGLNDGVQQGGVTFEAGISGNYSAKFDGVNDYIMLPAAETVMGNNPDEWSYAAWLKVEAFSSSTSGEDKYETVISDYYSASSADATWGMRLDLHSQGESTNRGVIHAAMRAEHGNGAAIISDNEVSGGEWVHAVVTVSKITGRQILYLNGTYDSEVGFDTSVDYFDSNTMSIGRVFYQGNSWGEFYGNIDDVRIYTRALSESDVRQLYSYYGFDSLENGLMAHYKFEGNPLDTSGNGNDGTQNGGVKYVSGIDGLAVSFDGVEDYIDLNAPLIPSIDNFSISFWVSPISNDYGTFVSQYNYPDEGRTFIGNYDSKGVTFKRNASGDTTAESFSSSQNLIENAWNHVAVVRDDDAIMISVNGIVESSLFSEDILITHNTILGARLVSGGGDQFHGHMDDLRIHNRALSLSEIRALAGVEPFDTASNLVAHYEFEGNANDSSVKGNDGNVYGGVSYISGKQGTQSAYFDGTGYIAVDSNEDTLIYDDLTISFWINAPFTSNSPIIGHNKHFADDETHNYPYDIRADENGMLHVSHEYGNGTNWLGDFAIQIPSDEWIHVAMRRDADNKTYTLFLDGKRKDIISYSIAPTGGSETLLAIGKKSFNAPNNDLFVGALDDVRIIADALSDAEMLQLYYDAEGNAGSAIGAVTPAAVNEDKPALNSSSTCPLPNKNNSAQGSPGPVLASTGLYAYTHNDITIPSLGIPLSVTRYYTSQDLYDGPFGHGWNMEYTARLILAEQTDGTVKATVHLGNGVRREFTQNPDGISYTAPTGQDDTLYFDGTYYWFNGYCGGTCLRKPRNAYLFDTALRLAAIEDMNGNRVSIAYDGNNRIATATNAVGRTLTFSYGTNGRVQTITDFSTPTRTWSYGYDIHDNLTSITDPLGNRMEYGYGADPENHNLQTITNWMESSDVDASDNIVATITYDANDRAIEFTDNGGTYPLSYDIGTSTTDKVNPASGNFSFTYDANGNIINKMTLAQDGATELKTMVMEWAPASVDLKKRSVKKSGAFVDTVMQYDGEHNLTQQVQDATGLALTTVYGYDAQTAQVSQITDPELGVTSMTYDPAGNLLSHAAPDIGTPSQFSYDPVNGNLLTSTDPDGVVTSYGYNANGYLTRVAIERDPEPDIETLFEYDERGNRTKKTDPNGNETNYTYDALDRLESVTDALSHTTQFDYDANGNLALITDPDGIKTRFVYDIYNRLESRTDDYQGALERTTTYSYDTRGNLETVTDPLNHFTTYTYDELSRVTSLKDHLNQTWTFAYDEVGNLTAKTDPNSKTTTYTYDTINRLESVTDAENQITSYTYDGLSRLETVTDANTNTATTNDYDAAGRLIETLDANQAADPVTYGSEQLDYTDAGRLSLRTDAKGQTTKYIYDAVTGHLERIEYRNTGTLLADPADLTETYTYDLAGNILSVTDGTSTVGYTYDALNRVETETQLSRTITYGYDPQGNRNSMTVSGIGVYGYGYDDLNRLVSITNPYTEVTQFEYDSADRRTRMVYGNGASTDYIYDDANRLTAVTHKKADDTVLAEYSYTYDNMNNRQSETNDSGTIGYSYDTTYKLLGADYPAGDDLAYLYDGAGNRTTKTKGVDTTQYNYDPANRLDDTTGSEAATYTFDKNGNIATKTDGTVTTTYTYDLKNQLVQVSDGTTTIDYQYDPTGRRISRMTGGVTTQFLYDGQNPLADLSIGGDTVYTPSLELDLLASQRQGATTQYFLRDGLNSVRQVMNADESIAGSYDYEPYGAIRAQTGSVNNTFTFTGRRDEGFGGLMYYRSRYYDTSIGGFLKKDTYKGGVDKPYSLHRYLYVNANPINYVDPDGRVVVTTGVILAIATYKTGKALYDGYKAHQRFTEKYGSSDDNITQYSEYVGSTWVNSLFSLDPINSVYASDKQQRLDVKYGFKDEYDVTDTVVDGGLSLIDIGAPVVGDAAKDYSSGYIKDLVNFGQGLILGESCR